MADDVQDVQDGSAQGQTPTEGAGAPATGFSPITSQEQFDSMLSKRLQKERDRAAAALDKAREEGRVAALAEAEEAQKRANMTEVEKALAAAATAEQKRVEAEARLAAAESARVRAEFISTKATDLPEAYRAMVAGATDEELTTSCDAARSAFVADQRALATRLATMTADQATSVLGEGHPLLERLTAQRQQPFPIGAPANGTQSAQAVPPTSEALNAGGMNAWLARAQQARKGG